RDGAGHARSFPRPARHVAQDRAAAARALRRRRRHAAGRGLPDLETEDVRPAVVPGRVEALASLVERLRIELRVEDALVIPERAGEVAAVRAEDRRAATAHELVALRERHVVRIAGRAREHARAEYERPSLARDVTDRVVPVLAVVRRRSQVHLNSRLVE